MCVLLTLPIKKLGDEWQAPGNVLRDYALSLLLVKIPQAEGCFIKAIVGHRRSVLRVKELHCSSMTEVILPCPPLHCTPECCILQTVVSLELPLRGAS